VPAGETPEEPAGAEGEGEPEGLASPEQAKPSVSGLFVTPQIINLIRVPGVQQVLLQVRIAELNRTALREIGADWLLNADKTILGTNISGNPVTGFGGGDGDGEEVIERALRLGLGVGTTAFGIFPSGEFSVFLRALRRNSVINVLAEPNLMALHGQQASFLAGGEFPVPVPQSATIGVSAITVEYKPFGVMLNFTPFILDDDTIRLRVSPEASTIDERIGTELQGFVVPGISTRRVTTTVELKQGQTLALAGLLSVDMDGETSRIPLLGDLPYIGVMFSNTSHQRQEKELLVLVTPFLVQAAQPGQVPPLPGHEVLAPNDLEFYLLSRIEGRTGRPHRPTTNWDNPLKFVELLHLESRHTVGPVGFSDQ
jgi:pilus assembly protein CpaC